MRTNNKLHVLYRKEYFYTFLPENVISDTRKMLRLDTQPYMGKTMTLDLVCFNFSCYCKRLYLVILCPFSMLLFYDTCTDITFISSIVQSFFVVNVGLKLDSFHIKLYSLWHCKSILIFGSLQDGGKSLYKFMAVHMYSHISLCTNFQFYRFNYYTFCRN